MCSRISATSHTLTLAFNKSPADKPAKTNSESISASCTCRHWCHPPHLSPNISQLHTVAFQRHLTEWLSSWLYYDVPQQHTLPWEQWPIYQTRLVEWFIRWSCCCVQLGLVPCVDVSVSVEAKGQVININRDCVCPIRLAHAYPQTNRQRRLWKDMKGYS